MRYEVRKFNDNVFVVYDTIDKVNISKPFPLIIANQICEDFNEMQSIKDRIKNKLK